ncbi:MAG: helix-hairpin-helix domain-containing protein [Dysgonamonadaceae bacterium]|jgi:hypothetical protein|nr:helix-hairpin-helix domain-containing protein [Dysgonamonadaceae bacterium]
MKIFFITLIISAVSTTAFAQTANSDWTSFLEELAESEDVEPADLEQLYDELSYLSEHPFNLNAITRADLDRLPFLSDIQVENILYYIYKFAPLVDIYELKNVDGLDRRTLELLLSFVYVGDTPKKGGRFSLKNALTDGKNEVLLRSDYTFQEKAGYADVSDEERAAHQNSYYIGEPYYLSLRYRYQYRNIQFGAAGEKDAGEAFWNKNHKGFDYYSANFNIKDLGVLESLHIGDYSVSYGQGLAVNSNFSMGKTSFINNINQQNSGIRRHVSTNENNFFRGMAANLKFGNFQTSFFYSNRKQDANADSAEIFTIKTDGYNRIPSDIAKRRTATISTVGAHAQWRNENFRFGLTAVYYRFGGKMMNPDAKPYNLFYLRAKEHSNYSVDYAWREKKLSFQGETAIDANGKLATLNNLLINPLSNIDLVLSYRNYARDYNAFYGKAFSESSAVQNENGLYSGLKFRPASRWEIAAYIDFFRFPWLKYGINSPSSGNDALVQIAFRPKSRIEMDLRYRYKQKFHNVISESGQETAVLPYDQHRLRYRLNWRLNARVEMRTQADANIYSAEGQNQTGYSVSQQFTYKSGSENFQIDGSLGYFHTSDYNSRITLYEKNILYAFSFPSYYGEGLRAYFVAKWKISKPLTLYLKLANTRYFDRETIGSGTEKIEGKNKTDVYCLIKYGF